MSALRFGMAPGARQMPACTTRRASNAVPRMSELGKWIMLIGAAMVAIGALFWGLGRLGFRGLPGDIRYESDGTRIYFPIVTCIVLSVLATALMWLWRWWGRK